MHFHVDRVGLDADASPSVQAKMLGHAQKLGSGGADLDHDSALDQLIANTDDAYGFPPFRYLAPAISVGGQDYHQLRQTEREILAEFLSHLRIRVLGSDSFGWADEIPYLIGRDARPASGASGTEVNYQ